MINCMVLILDVHDDDVWQEPKKGGGGRERGCVMEIGETGNCWMFYLVYMERERGSLRCLSVFSWINVRRYTLRHANPSYRVRPYFYKRQNHQASAAPVNHPPLRDSYGAQI